MVQSDLEGKRVSKETWVVKDPRVLKEELAHLGVQVDLEQRENWDQQDFQGQREEMDCLEDPVSLVLQDRLENLAKTGTKAK